MTSAAKQKGSSFERLIVNYLNEMGFDCERTRAGWTDDRGDIHGVCSAQRVPFTFECKNQRRIDLAGWTKELITEIRNAKGEIGAVVHKRIGAGGGEEQYATLPFWMLVQLLKEAGYK
jgi:Holliday junction resolvase